MRKLFVLTLALCMICAGMALADVRVPRMFSSNAVLQRDMPVKVWGWADAGEKVAVQFNGKSAETVADTAGNWCVTLEPMSVRADGSDLVITGKNTLTLQNVVVGEVWVCSGQSNMEWRLGNQSGTEEEYIGDYSSIRFLRDPHISVADVRTDLGSGQWTLCKDGAQKGCTAVGFHFAVRLGKELNVPVGLIDCNWGGSRIEAWMSAEAMAKLPEDMQAEVVRGMSGYGEANRRIPGGMYNGKLAPWTNYAIRGALWYQGCSNGGEGDSYYVKQRAMIEDWREKWGSEFPFYWVQLANFQGTNADPNQGLGWTKLRDAQTKCLCVPKTGQAVIIDVGQANDIHPRNKFDVGNRLAVLALAQDFGKDVACRSPQFESLKIDGNQAIVTFQNVGGGLVVGHQEPRNFQIVQDGTLRCFAVAGQDGKYFWAQAKILDGKTVVLTAPEVPAPVNVRYAWQMNPDGANLYSAEGLCATPFSTDNL